MNRIRLYLHGWWKLPGPDPGRRGMGGLELLSRRRGSGGHSRLHGLADHTHAHHLPELERNLREEIDASDLPQDSYPELILTGERTLPGIAGGELLVPAPSRGLRVPARTCRRQEGRWTWAAGRATAPTCWPPAPRWRWGWTWRRRPSTMRAGPTGARTCASVYSDLYDLRSGGRVLRHRLLAAGGRAPAPAGELSCTRPGACWRRGDSAS